MGAGRYADDVAAPHGTLHAAIVRSPHAHAEIDAIDASRALALPGVHAVLTGEDIAAMSDPFLIVLKKPIDQWALAVGRVRYVGEPVAVVIADDRYIAEDGVDLVDVAYNPLPVVVDPLEAVKPDAPLLHPARRQQRAVKARIHLRRPADRVRRGRAHRLPQGRIPAQHLHADGMFRRCRQLPARR